MCRRFDRDILRLEKNTKLLQVPCWIVLRSGSKSATELSCTRLERAKNVWRLRELPEGKAMFLSRISVPKLFLGLFALIRFSLNLQNKCNFFFFGVFQASAERESRATGRAHVTPPGSCLRWTGKRGARVTRDGTGARDSPW